MAAPIATQSIASYANLFGKDCPASAHIRQKPRMTVPLIRQGCAFAAVRLTRRSGSDQEPSLLQLSFHSLERLAIIAAKSFAGVAMERSLANCAMQESHHVRYSTSHRLQQSYLVLSKA
jgi:hypothetical protein